jgi:hypothetical protein
MRRHEELPRGCGIADCGRLVEVEDDRKVKWVSVVGHCFLELSVDPQALKGGRFLGIEQDSAYVRIARARIKHWVTIGRGAARASNGTA